jgi:hypothetical protein
MTGFAPFMLISGLMMNNTLGASTRENLEEDAAKVRAVLYSGRGSGHGTGVGRTRAATRGGGSQ